MKTFLKVDYAIQSILFLFIGLGILLTVFTRGDGIFLSLYTYLILGVWQPLSGMIHSVISPSEERAKYLVTVFFYLLGLFLFAQVIGIAALNMTYLLSSLMIAVWYFVITQRAYDQQNIVRSFWDLEI